MDDVQEEDGGYSDDDLDALPADAFHELQENAIKSTQQQKPYDATPGSALRRPFTKPSVSLGGGIGGALFGGNATQQARVPAHAEPPSSDYGDFDDEMLDGEIYNAAEQPAIPIGNAVLRRAGGDSSQREEWRQRRYGGLPHSRGNEQQQYPHKILGDVNEYTHIGGNNASYNSRPPNELSQSQRGEDVESLQAQIQEVSLFLELFCVVTLTYLIAIAGTRDASARC